MNPAVRAVEDIPGRGRGLVAGAAIKPGEIILAESPILLYPSLSSSLSSHCSHCYRSLSSSSSLPSCSCQALFCSERCHSAAALSSHTPFLCLSLFKIRALAAPPETLTQAAFLAAAYNLAAVSPSSFSLLLTLRGGASDHASPELPLSLHAFLASLSPPPSAAGFSPELTAALLAKDRMNAFGIMDPSSPSAVRAYGIYPSAALFNHDCLPNACRFDYVDLDSSKNTDIIVRAIHEISTGREICLSYFPVNWRFRERQSRLLEEYGFSCACDRCLVEKDWKDEEEDDDEEDEAMDEENQAEMEEEEEEEEDEDEDEEGDEEGDGSFPHAYFFARFMCEREGCGGTLAPLPPSEAGEISATMECNACGSYQSSRDG